MRTIDHGQVRALGLGAALLGSGGGGDPYLGELMARRALADSGPIVVVEPEEVADDALVVMTGMMGAPTVLVERPPGVLGQLQALRALSGHLGEEATHVTCVEIGGMNSTLPLIAAARTGLPLVDADGMGRAFPELQMVVPTLHGISAGPMAIADDKGNTVIVDADDNRQIEEEARSVCIGMGASAFIALYPMTGAQVKQSMIPGTLSMAQAAGEALLAAKASGVDPIEAVLGQVGGRHVFAGKVVSVSRKTEAGFAKGEFIIEGSGGYFGSEMAIAFQNENLVARHDGRVVVSVPDLISVVDEETGRPITTEEIRYGYRVAVLGIPCDQRWLSPAGLELVGPRYFGYETEYEPIDNGSRRER